MTRRTLLAAWAIPALAVLAGCTGDGRVPVVKTTGKVVWPGQKLLGLLVVFHATDPAAPKPPVLPTGVVQEDGTFAVTCYNTSDGAPPGEYVVTVKEAPRPDGAPMPTLPAAKYLDPKMSPLRAKVENKTVNELEPFEIKD
jgi:hypothetical protein